MDVSAENWGQDLLLLQDLTSSFAAAIITQSVKALAITCYGFAKDFAPGRQAKNSDQSADVFAPGQEKKQTTTPDNKR